MVAAEQRRRRGLAPIPPHPDLCYAENFFQKRPGGPVTCCDGWMQGADLCICPFGRFTVMPVDAAGSPRKVPGDSHCRRPLFRLYAG
ncbi:hypothetical protein GZL_08108 [Streptomyces sp. 769]|nr:hypothetical protein GZL_08108 [Streptomyces sp. 769]